MIIPGDTITFEHNINVAYSNYGFDSFLNLEQSFNIALEIDTKAVFVFGANKGKFRQSLMDFSEKFH